jgi:Spy/CpxP family protein refolding chaperone
MIMNKFILGALMAGCLSVSASFAADTAPAGPTAEQKAKLEELKAKLEAKRGDWKAHQDSLTAEQKAEIEKRIAEHKAEMEKRKAERAEVKEQIKALVEAFKDKIKSADDSTKAALAKELAAKLKELHGSVGAGIKGRFDAGKGERLKDIKADFAAHRKEIEAKRAEWLKDHADGDKPVLTAEQLAELKAKYEEWLKTHADAGATP